MARTVAGSRTTLMLAVRSGVPAGGSASCHVSDPAEYLRRWRKEPSSEAARDGASALDWLWPL